MSTFEIDVYASKFFPHLPPKYGRQVCSEAVNREADRRQAVASSVKNRLLVHQAGRVITMGDVQSALGENMESQRQSRF